MAKQKTGEVFYRDDNGILHIAISYSDKNGNVSTTDEVVDECNVYP